MSLIFNIGCPAIIKKHSPYYKIKIITTAFLSFFIINISFSQIISTPYFSPGISFGYTFGAGINYGAELDLGLLNFDYNNFPLKSGLTISKYWTHTKNDIHRHRAISLMFESSYFDFKIGYGNVKNPWGQGGNRNACREKGLHLDLSATSKQGYVPWVGYKIFIYKKRNWAWYNRNYHSAFLKYKYDLTQTSDLKTY